MGTPIEKHTPLRLSPIGYKRLCALVDDRDGGCVVCGNPNVQHHHIYFRSEGGEDTLENLISLCPDHHSLCGHGENKHGWQREFMKYMDLPQNKDFARDHSKELAEIYQMKKR